MSMNRASIIHYLSYAEIEKKRKGKEKYVELKVE
jgi:hypothetical protein